MNRLSISDVELRYPSQSDRVPYFSIKNVSFSGGMFQSQLFVEVSELVIESNDKLCSVEAMFVLQ